MGRLLLETAICLRTRVLALRVRTCPFSLKSCTAACPLSICTSDDHIQKKNVAAPVDIGTTTGSTFGPLDEAVARARIVNLCLCLFVALRPNFFLLLDDVCNLDVQSWNVLVEFVTLVGAHKFNVLTVATSRPFGEVNDPYLEQIAYVPNLKIISKMDHVSIHTLPDFEPEHMRELVRHNLNIPASALPTSVFNFLVNTYVVVVSRRIMQSLFALPRSSSIVYRYTCGRFCHIVWS